MDIFIANITYFFLQDLLYSILIFKSGFKKLIFTHKSLIFIDNIPVDLDQIFLKVYRYKSNLEVALPPHNKTAASSPSSTFLLIVYTYATFVNIIIKNKTIYK